MTQPIYDIPLNTIQNQSTTLGCVRPGCRRRSGPRVCVVSSGASLQRQAEMFQCQVVAMAAKPGQHGLGDR